MASPCKQKLILIVDRNPHVRGYLKREMLDAGYRVELAGSCRDVVETINSSRHIDGIIIDPDLPDKGSGILEGKLEKGPAPIPVIIHSLLKKSSQDFFFCPREIIVEKGGASIERLKNVLTRLL